MAVSAVREKSPTYDEVAHLTAGYSYWTLEDFRLHPENGAFPQRWASLPLLWGGYEFPSLNTEHWRFSDVWQIGYRFFYSLGNDLATMLLEGRGMIAVLGVVLGLLVYVWSCSLFGNTGGAISLVLYVFSPTMLAHGSLITSDLAAALGLTAATWLFWRQLYRMTPGSVLSSGLAIAVLFLSKISAVLIIPIAVLLVLVRLFRSAPLAFCLGRFREIQSRRGQLLAFAVSALIQVFVVVLLIWANHGFQYSAFRVGIKGGETFYGAPASEGSSAVERSIQLGKCFEVLPEAYLHGFSHVLGHLYRLAFLNGEYSGTGWWHFFPYVFLVKTPLPLFVILIMALCALGTPGHWGTLTVRGSVERSRLDRLYELSPLLILLGVYWAAAVTTSLNLGHRHLLPTYPALFIIAGAASVWLSMRRKLLSLVLMGAIAWFIVESLVIRPHYLAYFNVFAGGPEHAYRHVVDSSLDWGQDLPGVKHWLDDQRPDARSGTRVYLSYFGTAEPGYYGISVTRLPGYPKQSGQGEGIQVLTGGVYLISATSLQSLYGELKGPWTEDMEKRYRALQKKTDIEKINTYLDRASKVPPERREPIHPRVKRAFSLFNLLRFSRLLAYLRHREPDGHIGYSILIFRLTDEEVNRALHGPPIFG